MARASWVLALAALLPLGAGAAQAGANCLGGQLLLSVCTYDANDDRVPDGAGESAQTAVLVGLVYVEVQEWALAADGSGDGVPDDVEVTPVWLTAGFFFIDLGCWMTSPGNLDCVVFVCAVCDGVTATLEDVDGDGVPDEAFVHTPAGDAGPVALPP